MPPNWQQWTKSKDRVVLNTHLLIRLANYLDLTREDTASLSDGWSPQCPFPAYKRTERSEALYRNCGCHSVEARGSW